MRGWRSAAPKSAAPGACWECGKMERVLSSRGLLSVCWWRAERQRGQSAGAMEALGKQEGPRWVSGRAALGCPLTRGTALRPADP